MTRSPANDDECLASFPSNYKGVTFVGRPFPLEKAHEHFSRLRRWGLTFSMSKTTYASDAID